MAEDAMQHRSGQAPDTPRHSFQARLSMQEMPEGQVFFLVGY